MSYNNNKLIFNNTTIMYAKTPWFPIALPMVIKYQIILLSKFSKIGRLYVVYWMLIVDSHPVR
jgi:hypothetical protein